MLHELDQAYVTIQNIRRWATKETDELKTH